MKVSEVKPKMSNVDVEVEVTDKGDVREFQKFGKVGRVCNITVKDDSGSVKMTLWNDDIDRIKVGDKLKLINGYVNEFRGEMQLTTGRAGKIEVVGSGDGEAPAKKSAKPAKKEAKKQPEPEEVDSYEDDSDKDDDGDDSDDDDSDDDYEEEELDIEEEDVY